MHMFNIQSGPVKSTIFKERNVTSQLLEFRGTLYVTLFLKNKNKTLMLPYYPSSHDLLLQQCCTQKGKRSIKGSLLTSRFCKCYGLVKDSWPSFVFNCSCNSNVKWLHERINENKWKSFERKTALKNNKKRSTSCLKLSSETVTY